MGIEGFIRQVYMRKKNITHGSENHMSSQNRNLEVQYTPCSDTPIFVAYNIYIYHIIIRIHMYIYTVYILTMIVIDSNNANNIILYNIVIIVIDFKQQLQS